MLSREIHSLLLDSKVFASTGICSSATPLDECKVVRGLTSILLDTSADGVAALAYEVVVEVLSDLPALNEYLDTPLLHAEFVREIGENLVLHPSEEDDNDSSGSNGTSRSGFAKIAIISAVTAFALSAIFFFSLHKRQQTKEDESVHKMRLAYYQAKKRKFWSRLQEDEDQHTYPGLMMTEPGPTQTVTWSVSDLTSESASIKSALKMDRIDEEYEGGSNESQAGDLEAAFDELYEEVREEHVSSGAYSQLPRPSLELPACPPFITHWQDDHSELATRGTDLTERVWELARLPKSYWDVSDPEAPTPDHSPSSFRESPERTCLDDGYELEYYDDEGFADRALDFSNASPTLPAVTYTTEEEECSQTSTSPANTNRTCDGTSMFVRHHDSSSPNSDTTDDASSIVLLDPLTAETELSSPVVKLLQETFPVVLDETAITAPLALTVDSPEKKETVDPPATTMTTAMQSMENPAVSMDEESQAGSQDSGDVVNDADDDEEEEEVVVENTLARSCSTSECSSSDESQDGEDSVSSSTSSATVDTLPTTRGKADVFYTPKQDVTSMAAERRNDDTLESVAKTIVREAEIYDEATQRWARRVLEEITSPKPMLLAATPHNYYY